MTDLQTRLREGLRAEAARAQPHLLREPRLPPPGRRAGAWPWRRGAAGRLSRMLPWLAPVAAALAVVAIISAVRLTADGVPDGTSRTTPSGGPAAAAPPYYVSAAVRGQAQAWVRSSATGQVVGKVGVPGQLPIAITAAADDRTFVIVFQDLYDNAITTITRLTLGASGHPASFARLPLKLPAYDSLQPTGGIALSPDGRTLALALNVVHPKAAIAPVKHSPVLTNAIELLSLRTGAARTWPAPPGIFVTAMSWARGNQTLGFLAAVQGGPPNDPAGQVRILEVSRPAGGLISSSTPVRLRTAGGRVQSMQVTGNGSQVVAWTRLPSRPISPATGALVLAEFSVRTGRQLRVFSRLPTVNGVAGSGQIYSADPSGQHILIYGLRILSSSHQVTRTDSFFGRLDHGQLTRLPSSGDGFDFGAW